MESIFRINIFNWNLYIYNIPIQLHHVEMLNQGGTKSPFF